MKKLFKRFKRSIRGATITAIEKFEDFKDRRALAKFEKQNPDVDIRLVPDEALPTGHDPNGKLSLFKEKLDGRNAREDIGLPPVPPTPPPSDTPRPVFRKDGQIHNFSAASGHPATGRNRNKKGPFTREQYDARYGGNRPVPRNAVPAPGIEKP